MTIKDARPPLRESSDYPKPIHDYHDSEKYNSKNAFWEWEFLRRNSVYQDKCDAWLKKRDDPLWAMAHRATFNDINGWFPSWALEVVGIADGSQEPVLQPWHYREERRKIDIEISKRGLVGSGRLLPFPWHIAGPLVGPDWRLADDAQYDDDTSLHLKKFLDPDSDFSKILWEARSRIPRVDDRLLLLAFDVGAPLAPQIERLRSLYAGAREKLEEREKARPGEREPEERDPPLTEVEALRSGESSVVAYHGSIDWAKGSYLSKPLRWRDAARLLRVLDGMASGASDKQLAAVLEQDERQVRRDKARAVESQKRVAHSTQYLLIKDGEIVRTGKLKRLS